MSMQVSAKTRVDRDVHRPAIVPWMRLARVYHRIDRRTAEQLRLADLTVAQFDVLAQIGAREGINQQELADRLLVTKGNVCQLLDRLEARGLVERRHPPGGRGNLLFLTRAGAELRAGVLPEQQRTIRQSLSGLNAGELDQLSRLLRKIERSLDDQIAAPQGADE